MEHIIEAILNFAHPLTLLFVFVGSLWGLVAGSLPGISAAMAVILMLPFTYGMDGIQSIIVLVAVYVTAMCGGSFSAILLKTPGTPAAVATTFDGYPLTLQGKASRALGLAITGSAVGGILSGIILVVCAPLLARWALRFQSAEFFALALLGLSCIASIGSSNPLKAMISGCMGLLFSTVGLDAFSGNPRYTFGTFYLMSGIDFVPVMIGAYAVAEVLRNITEGKKGSSVTGDGKTVKAELIGIRHIVKNWVVYIKSSVIGTVVGIIPAAGGSIAALISYGEAARSSKTPEKFGKGAEEGVIAAEAANNAAAGGSLVPTLTLGIPGGNVTAILLAAFTMHGLTPGPLLLINQPSLLYSVLLGIVAASLLLFVLGSFISRQFSRITSVPYPLLGTLILTLGVIGSFALRNSIVDVYIMFGFCFLGYFFDKYKYSTSSFILGMILGSIAENGLRRQLMVSGGDWSTFFTRPISLIVILLAVISFASPYYRAWRKKKQSEKAA